MRIKTTVKRKTDFSWSLIKLWEETIILYFLALQVLTPNPLSGKPKKGLLNCIPIDSPSLLQQRGGIKGGEYM
jgi:hypothetical protein